MSKKKKPLNLPIEPETPDAPVEAGPDQEERTADENEEQVPADEDRLADIRRSLVEEEILKQEKKRKGIFHRISRLFKARQTLPTAEAEAGESEPGEDEPVPVVGDVREVDEDTAPSLGGENAPVAEAVGASEPDAGGENAPGMPGQQYVAEFIPETEPVELIPETPQDELPLPPEIVEPTRGSEVLRTQLESEKADESFETIREVALQDYSESPVQAEDKPVISVRQRLRILLRGMKPLDKVMIFGAVGLICIGATIGIGSAVINARAPEATPEPTQDLPIPVRVTLPGGWEFKLARGRVENDQWSPAGAEWLEGTEICKWVALPWSLQLEAVIRTLESNDPIELTMSNADQLTYRVYSIQNVPVEQIDTLERQTPCLLLILVNKGVDTRWVVTALP